MLPVIGNRRSLWVLDNNKRLLGWIDSASLPGATSISEILVRGNIDEISVANGATLREALSRMLGQGFKSIPVVDGAGHLIGEVTLSDIEVATAEMENGYTQSTG